MTCCSQALDFILEKLVSQSYGPEGAANRVNEPLYGTSTVFMPTMPTELPATDAVNQVCTTSAQSTGHRPRTLDMYIRYLDLSSQYSPTVGEIRDPGGSYLSAAVYCWTPLGTNGH
mgnify:CR=1 FL=1